MFTKIRELRRKFKELPFLVQLFAISPSIAILIFFWISFYLSTSKLTDQKDVIQVRKDVLQITSQIFLGAAGLSAAIFAWQRLEVSREDQITDRYTRAIDQLGNDKLAVRLGGIYALERLAKDSKKDQETVMEVLTAFIRENSSLTKSEKNNLDESSDENSDKPTDKEEEKIPEKTTPNTDVQAILTVIGRRKWEVAGRIDLSGVDLSRADLRGADLREADLSRATLYGVNLRGADLSMSTLSGAYLFGADLSKGSLTEATLMGATLSKADLTKADLSGTKLIIATLHGANLSRATLSGATLSGADMFEANLSGAKEITVDQIKQAINWEQAHYSDDFKAQLGLPTTSEEIQEKPEEQPPPQN